MSDNKDRTDFVNSLHPERRGFWSSVLEKGDEIKEEQRVIDLFEAHLEAEFQAAIKDNDEWEAEQKVEFQARATVKIGGGIANAITKMVNPVWELVSAEHREAKAKRERERKAETQRKYDEMSERIARRMQAEFACKSKQTRSKRMYDGLSERNQRELDRIHKNDR